MNIKVKEPRLVNEYGKGWTVSFLIDGRYTETAKRMVDELREKEIRMQLSEWKNHRSISANAYFHVLVGKIAEVMKLGEDEVKRGLVLNYGAQARDKDGAPIWINLPQDVVPESFGIKYAKWFNVTEVRGKKHDCYIVFAETHTYDTKQFSRLLDGAIRDAKELGIETLPPEELARMMQDYAKAYKKTTDTNSGKEASL